MAEIRQKKRRKEDAVIAAVSCICLGLCAWLLVIPHSAANQSARRPASLEKVEAPSRSSKSRAVVVAERNSVGSTGIICLDRDELQEIKTAATMIRIQAKNCNAKKKIGPLDGVNETNHFSLEFIKMPKEASWTSNYFQLNAGKNEISLRIDQGNGRKQEKRLRIISGN